MTDSSQRFGAYDPFEDTGDWPFRDAPARPREEPAPAPEQVSEPAFEEPVLESTDPEPVLVVAEEPVAVLDVEDDEGAAEEDFDVEEDEEEEDAEDEEEDDFDEGEEDEEEGEDGGYGDDDEYDDELSEPAAEHAPGGFVIPGDVDVLTGAPHGFRRSVAVVVSRFNGELTTKLLDNALAALREAHVAEDAITVVPVPGAFELPITALALAKTRRYACVVALGCIIRGETPHFDIVAAEAASGLQLAGIETGVPVSFGVLTCDTREQAEARVERGAEAARVALEMADLFSHVRTRAAQQ